MLYCMSMITGINDVAPKIDFPSTVSRAASNCLVAQDSQVAGTCVKYLGLRRCSRAKLLDKIMMTVCAATSPMSFPGGLRLFVEKLKDLGNRLYLAR
jgi:hypothetical protein